MSIRAVCLPTNTVIYFTNIRYECALIQNKLHHVPVFPVFLAEIVDDNGAAQFTVFNFAFNFPDAPHRRDPSSQSVIDDLG